MAQNIKINGVIFSDVDYVKIPKADGSGDATYHDASDVVYPMDVVGIIEGTVTEINDVNGEVDGTIVSRVFNDNDTLTSVVLPAATHMSGEVFRGCGNLTNVELNSCINISDSAFRDCSNLETAIVPSAESVGQYAFSGCGNLTELSLPICTSFNTYAFQNCSNLETLYAPEVTTLTGGYIFTGTTKLTSVNFPKVTSASADDTFRGSGIVSATFSVLTTFRQRMFRYSSNLTTVIAPSATTIASEAFLGTSLNKLVLANNSVATLQNVSAFTSTPVASGTGYVYVPDTLVNSYKSASNWSTYASQIKSINELG